MESVLRELFLHFGAIEIKLKLNFIVGGGFDVSDYTHL